MSNSSISSIEEITARLFFNAAFPVMAVVLEDDPALQAAFRDVRAVVEIGAPDLYCHLVFDRGHFAVVQGQAPSPDLCLHFSTVKKMNAMFRGGAEMPAIKGGLRHLPLLIKTFRLLMSLMLMMPKSRPRSPAKQRLKVKMSLYMITRALSTYNKLGDPEMAAWCRRQPDRIYQFIVDGEENEKGEKGEKKPAVACYLRVKQGRSKSGHGVYTRRSPFVLFHFFSVEGAMKVLLREVGFVEGVEKGYVETVGSPEYAVALNDFMAVLQGLLT